MAGSSIVRLGLAAAVLITAGGCRDANAGNIAALVAPASKSERPPAPAPAVAADPSAREAAVAAWLAREFPLQRDYFALYRRSVDAKIAEIDACRTAACRQRARAARTAAIDFAEGRPARIAGLPFAAGLFQRAEAGFSGVARIIPTGTPKPLLAIALSFRARPSCALAATMTQDNTGNWTVVPADGEGKPLTLARDGKAGFVLAYVDPDHQPYDDSYCSVGVGLDGRYVPAR